MSKKKTNSSAKNVSMGHVHKDKFAQKAARREHFVSDTSPLTQPAKVKERAPKPHPYTPPPSTQA